MQDFWMVFERCNFKMEIPFINRMFDESSPTASVSRMASMLFTNWNPGHGGLDVVLLSEGENNAVWCLFYIGVRWRYKG